MPIPTLVVGLLVGEDQATGGHEHASDALDEGRFDAFDLVGGLASDLADGLLDSVHPVHARVGV